MGYLNFQMSSIEQQGNFSLGLLELRLSNQQANLLQYQKESPKLHFGLFVVHLNSFGNLTITLIIIHSS